MKRLALLPLLLAALPASADYRQLVKTSDRHPVLVPLDPRHTAVGICRLETFTPTTRSFVAAGTELPHSNPFGSTCHQPFSLIGGYQVDITFNPRSLNDMGRYVLLCTDVAVTQGTSVGPCETFGTDCNGSPRSICRGHLDPAYRTTLPDQRIVFEAFNNPPTASAISMAGSGIVAPGVLRHDASVDFMLSASDADGDVTVTWDVVKPAGATGSIFGSGTNAHLTLGGESNFGTWTIRAHVDDRQGERVTQTMTVRVENQPLMPTLSGSTRVVVGRDIELTLSADDDGGDYASVSWSAQRPGGVDFLPLKASGRTLTLPTTAMDLGTWVFRAEATDNDTFPGAFTGTADLPVEVVNELPVITLAPAPARVRPGMTLNLSATAVDPDGGALRSLTWRAVQAPASAGVAVGTRLSTTGTLSLPMGAASAGTWVFRATAEDDEGGTAESPNVVVVVDVNPVGLVRGAPALLVGPGPFSLVSESYDPDSHCANPADPNRCHVVEPGVPFTPLSPGIDQWRWYFSSVPSSYRLHYPVGARVNTRFPTAEGALGALNFIQDGNTTRTLPPGDWGFRLEVRDAEGNFANALITLRVRPPLMPPFAVTTSPRRFLANVSRTLLEDVYFDGSLSFDPDELATTGPSPGIVTWLWTALPPPGCTLSPSLPSAPVSRLFTAGTTLPAACFGVWTAQLIVVDNDGQASVAEAHAIIGNCAGGTVCIDKPTQMNPYTIDTASPVNVPIYFYVDASIHAAHPGGFYALIDILPAGSTTPLVTLTDISASLSPGVLTSVIWHGETSSSGTATSGTYDVRVRLKSLAWADITSRTERFAIMFENVTVSTSATSRYIRHQDLQAGTALASFSYTVGGAISMNQVRSTITRAGAVVYELTASTTSPTGTIAWNGVTTSGALATPGEYALQVSAFRGTHLLKRSAPLKFVVYRLQLGPAAPARPLVSVGLNRDDDNLSGVRDQDELAVAGENDLANVLVQVQPSTLAGSLAVRQLTPGGGIAFFSTSAKAAARPLPLTVTRPTTALPVLWVEGRQPGLYDVELVFTPPDAPALQAERTKISVYGIELVSDVPPLRHALTDPPAAALVPGSWENGHAPSAAFDPADPSPWLRLTVLNDPSSNFVDNDPEHFFVRVFDADANRDPGARETLLARVGTLAEFPATGGETFADPLNEVTLVETEIDSSVFVSAAQLLTSIDRVLLGSDDAFEAVGPVGPVADEARDDRTHRIGVPGRGFLAGGVRAEYTRATGAQTTTVPVCGRAPEQRRYVNIKFAALNEPYLDLGYELPDGSRMGADDGQFSFINSNTSTDLPDGTPVHDPEEVSEPYWDLTTGEEFPFEGGPTSAMLGRSGRGAPITELGIDRQLEAANAALAPLCVELRRVGTFHVLEAPVDMLGHSILDDGIMDFTAREHLVLYQELHARLGFGPIVGDNVFVVYGPQDIQAVAAGGTGDVVTAFGATMDPELYPLLSGASLVIMRGYLPESINRVLAHELGHVLSNGRDAPQPVWQLFPASYGGAPDIGYIFRRIPKATRDVMLSPRTPASDYSAPGNNYLRDFP